MAGIERVLGDPAVQLHRRLRPAYDVTGHVTSAGREAVDVVVCECVGPELQV